MVSTNGNDIISAFTGGSSVKAIYAYGELVWPVPPYYIKWTQSNAYGTFTIGGQRRALSLYKGAFYDFDGTIDAGAFSSLTGVALFNTVDTNATYIGASAFKNCTSLSAASISCASIIGYGAFESCYALTGVRLDACVGVSSLAFQGCESLTEVRLGSSCSYIGDQAFFKAGYNPKRITVTVAYRDALISFGSSVYGFGEVSYNVPAYMESSYTNVSRVFHNLRFDDKYFDYMYCLGPNLGEPGEGWLYPRELSSASNTSSFETDAVGVGESCCLNMTNLQSVSLSHCGLVEAHAFEGCVSLKSVYAPYLNRISSYAFKSCYQLQDIVFDVQYIESGAFMDCSSLTRFETGKKCYWIESSAFKNCINLSVFMVGTGFSTHSYLCDLLGGSKVFEGCDNLQYIYVPSSLYSAYKSADGWSYYSYIIYSY